MDARTAWTVALTALSAPVGAVAAGAALARIADATQGGMAGLAAGVVGLFVGGPFLAFLVFIVCTFALARPNKRAVAIGLMFVACVVDGAVVIVGLAITARTQADTAGILAVGLMSMAVLGVGAWLALRASRGSSRADARHRIPSAE